MVPWQHLGPSPGRGLQPCPCLPWATGPAPPPLEASPRAVAAAALELADALGIEGFGLAVTATGGSG